MNRKDFLKNCLKIGGSVAFGGLLNNGLPQEKKEAEKVPAPTPGTPASDGKAPDIVVVEGNDAGANVRKAIDALGGISKFVKKDAKVVIKPNIGWDRIPAQAANTNPDVVAEIVKLCKEAGAKEILVFDFCFNDARSCYKRSGIQDAAEKAGAKVEFCQENLFKMIAFPGTTFIKEWQVYKKVLEADCYINVPIAKHHSSAGLTLAMKNNMGVIGGNRGHYHQQMDRSIAELCTQLKPHLVIMDAYRILLNNGPQGGSLKDVEKINKCIAGTNQVSVDAYTTTLFKKKPTDLGYLKIANELGLGEIDLAKLIIKTIKG